MFTRIFMLLLFHAMEAYGGQGLSGSKTDGKTYNYLYFKSYDMQEYAI